MFLRMRMPHVLMGQTYQRSQVYLYLGQMLRDSSRNSEDWKLVGFFPGSIVKHRWSWLIMVCMQRHFTICHENCWLFFTVDTKPTKIWNVYAAIPGHIADEVVMVGNHRDGKYYRSDDCHVVDISFSLGHGSSGSYFWYCVPPWSRSWIFSPAEKWMETFANDCFCQLGCWRGVCTVIFLGAVLIRFVQYGLVGSTEYGEDFPEWISQNVVSYLNIGMYSSVNLCFASASVDWIVARCIRVWIPLDCSRITLLGAPRTPDSGGYPTPNSPTQDSLGRQQRWRSLRRHRRRGIHGELWSWKVEENII